MQLEVAQIKYCGIVRLVNIRLQKDIKMTDHETGLRLKLNYWD